MTDKKYYYLNVDGKEHEVDVELFNSEGGANAYASAYEGSTIRMRDNDKNDYDVPLDKYDRALRKGLHPFTTLKPGKEKQETVKSELETIKPFDFGKAGAVGMSGVSQAPGVMDNSTLAERLKEPAKIVNEEAGIDKIVEPIEVKTYDDISNKYLTRYSHTEEGKAKQQEIANLQDKLVKTYSDELYGSEEYKDIINSNKTLKEKDEALNKLWNEQYLSKINDELEPIQKEYYSSMQDRYKSNINKESKDLHDKNLEQSYNDLSTKIEQAKKQNKKKVDFSARVMPNYTSSQSARYSEITNEKDRQARAEKQSILDAADNIIKEQQKLIQAVKDEKDGTFVGGVLRGLKDQAFNLDNWTMGLSGLRDGKTILDVCEKAERNEELTSEEQMLMDAVVNKAATESYLREQLGRGYKAGEVTGISLPFMVDMMTGMAAVRGATSVASKGLLKYIAKKYGQNRIKKEIAKGTYGIAKGVADASLHSATLGSGRVAENYLERNIGRIKTDEKDGKTVYSGREEQETGVKAFGKAFGSTVLESQSELIGEQFAPITKFIGSGIMKLPGINKIPFAKVGEYIGSNSGANVKAVKDFISKTQYHGVVNEYLEEVYNNMGSVVMGDMTTEELLDLDNNIDTLLGVSVIGTTFSAANTGAFIIDKHKTNKEINRFESLMRDEDIDFDAIKSDLANTDIEGAKKFIKETLADNSLTPDEKKEEVKYIANVLKSIAIEQAENNQEEVNAEDIEENKVQTNIDYYNAQFRFKQLPNQIQAMVNKGFVDNIPEEYKDVAIEWLAAKQDYDNYQNHVNNKVETAKQQAREDIEKVVNTDTQSVISVNTHLSPEPIKITKGRVVFLEDGDVDLNVSDETLYYIDKNGKTQPMHISKVISLNNSSDAQELISEAERNAEIDVINNEQAQIPKTPEIGDIVNRDGVELEVLRVDADGIVVNDGTNDYLISHEEWFAPYNTNKKIENEAENEISSSSNYNNLSDTADIPQKAIDRIPKDAKGEPIYEQTDIDTAWDALIEQTEGDEIMAQTVANSMVADKETALKKLEKSKLIGGASITEKIEAEKERKAAIDLAKQELDHWKNIAGTANRRKQEAEAEQRRVAKEAEAIRKAEEEKLRAEREEAERIEREALNGVPDVIDDNPKDARARGYRRVNGHKVDRQEAINGLQGKEIAVKFSDNTIPTGRVAIIEAGLLQPSHNNGVRNSLHFIDEAQPKERKDEASILSAQKIASNIRPEEITSSVTAYTGAPTVNVRGEVIQGNNRSAALRQMWESHKEQATKYKRYLIDHAEEFGLKEEDIRNMNNPVLVNMIDVDDAESITLGQYVAQDTESGGTERIKPKNALQKIGNDIRTFANMLLKSSDDETSFSGLVDNNGVDVLKWMSKKGYITPTQYKSAFDSKGNLTAEAKNDLRGIMYQNIFKDGSTQLEEMFNAMAAKAQKAILATAYRDYDSPSTERMNDEIQNSIRAYYALSHDADFVNAKNYKEARAAVEAWKLQYQIDDVTGDSYLPSDKFSNFALHLATIYKGETQLTIQGIFNQLFDLIQGTQETTLFEQPDNTPRTLEQAIKETLNIHYNGQPRNNVLGGSDQTSQPGRRRNNEDIATGERIESGKQTADSAGRTESDSGQGRTSETYSVSKEKEINLLDPRTMSEEEKQRRGDMLRNAPAIDVKTETITSTPELSARKAAEKWWDENVNEPALYDTEAGEVEINRNSIESSLAHRYGQKKLDAITSLIEGFENAVYLGTMPDSRERGVIDHYFAYPIMYDGELNFVFCRAMQDANKNRLYVHEVFVGEKIKKGDTLQTAASKPHGGISLYRDILANVLQQEGKLQYRFDGGAQTEHRPANVSVTASPEEMQGKKQEDTSSEGGTSSISHTAETAPAISLQSRGDVMLNDDNSSISKTKETTNSINSKEFVEKNDIPLIGEKGKAGGAEQNTNLGKRVTEKIGGVEINHIIPPSGDEVDIKTLEDLRNENVRLLSESAKEFAKKNNVADYEANLFIRVAVNPDKRLGERKSLQINKANTATQFLEEFENGIRNTIIVEGGHITEAYAKGEKIESSVNLRTKDANMEAFLKRMMAENLQLKGIESNTSKEIVEKNDVKSASEQVKAAEAEVNINPTDNQKKAGNYKKGHVQIGIFNVTIEQPKGSVRSGVDANGKKWEIEMQNSYGYIRGTEGMDGDHIDVFLSNDIDDWNGRQVYVIDQLNADGSFDEHKVMLGFNDINEAREGYMNNYEKGWQGLGMITGVAIEDFEKWIDSSHRKTKAFAEYKTVKITEEQIASADSEKRLNLANFILSDESNRYNIKEYKAKDGKSTKYTQLSLFDENGEAFNNRRRIGGVQQEGDSKLSTLNTLRQLNEGEVCYVERKFSETKEFNFTKGEKIESVEDVAYIFKNLEDEAIENAFAAVLKEGEVTVLHIGMGLQNATIADATSIISAADKLNADKIYFVHNHPSGKLETSMNDLQMYSLLKEAFGDKLAEGIIINTRSGKYAIFNEKGWLGTDSHKEQKSKEAVSVYKFNKQAFSSNAVPKIYPNSNGMAEFISTQRLGKRDKINALLLDNSLQCVGNVLLTENKITSKNAEKVIERLVADSVSMGAKNIVLYGRFPLVSINGLNTNLLSDLSNRVKKLSANSVMLLDIIQIEDKDVKSANDEGIRFRLTDDQQVTKTNKEDDALYRSDDEIKINEIQQKELNKLPKEISQFVESYLKSHNSAPIIVIAEEEDVNSLQIGNKLKDSIKDDFVERKTIGYRVNINGESKIIIFANVYKGDELTLTHENVHDQIKRRFYDAYDNSLVNEIYDVFENKYSPLLDFIKRNYSEKAWKNEFATELLSSKLVSGTINDIIQELSEESQYNIYDISKSLNYGNRRGKENSDEKGSRRNGEEDNTIRSNMWNSENGQISRGRGEEEEKRRGKEETVNELSKLLNTPIEIIRDVNDIHHKNKQSEARRRKAKGWFEPSSGKVVIVLPNATSEADVQATMLHEIVAHKGLKEMLGKDNFNSLCDNVFDSLPKEIQERLYKKYKSKTVAGDEYMASIAEKGIEANLWKKVKAIVKQAFRSIGIDLKISDNDIAYLLWKSKNRLMNGDTQLDIINKIAKDEDVKDTLYRDSDKSREMYNKSVTGREFVTQEAFQDSMLSLKKLQEVVEEVSGKKIQSFENAYDFENRLSSMNTNAQRDYYDEHIVPIEKELHKIMTQGATYDDIKDYLIAKHGLERNKVLARRDAQLKAEQERDEELKLVINTPNISDEERERRIGKINYEFSKALTIYYNENRENDYSGLTSLMADDNEKIDVKEAEKRADEFVNQFEKDRDTNRLWLEINRATNATLRKSFDSGVISKETYERTKDMFEYYVPLRGWEEETAEDIYEYLQNKTSPFNPTLNKTKGRKSIAQDPIAVIGNMADSAILQGNRNLLKQAFMSMAVNHPTDLVQVKKAWYVQNPVTKEWELSLPKISDTDSPEMIEQKFKDHEETMKELKKEGKAEQKTNGLNIDYRASKRQQSEHMVIVKRNGKDHILFVNGNPRAAQAINGLTNPDVENNKFLQALSIANRFLAANFTTRNPAFVMSNLSRDLIYATSMVSVKESPEYALNFTQNIPSTWKMVYNHLRGKKNGEFEEFLNNGGETGYMTLTDVDGYKRKLKHDLKLLEGDTKAKMLKSIKFCTDRLEDFNRLAENISRFNAYRTSRMMGRSVSESIKDAKEVTVNFNKKGAGLKSYNSHKKFYDLENLIVLTAGGFKMTQIFFNAAVQGLVNMGRIAKAHKGKTAALLGSFTMAGMLMPIINDAIYSLCGDGDDDPYADLPEWVRRNNLCIYCGEGNFITIPLPIELRAFYGLGDIIYEFATNKNISGGEFAYNISNQFTELLPLNPLGGNGDMVATLMPSVIKPIYEIMSNKDFMGKPIYKETPFNELSPEYKRVYKGTSELLVKSSEALNSITGGYEFKKGWGDFNPAKLEHAFESYFGGLGKTLNQTAKTLYHTGSSLVNGEMDENLVVRNVPIINRFINHTDERGALSGLNKDYDRLLKQYEIFEYELNNLSKYSSILIPEYLEKLTELQNSKDFQRHKEFEGYKSQIDYLYKLKKLYGEGEHTKEIDNNIINLKREVIDKMNNSNIAN